ncbi:hypothetical protein HZH66_001425 [Vespula vulgaris]|uniref:Uncharacterized protein n=1 Tax=Vespula vulgaris TaxID=7454 RepID=A0A834KWJ5_VESVU|nr:hypothetical protein HZH66_001425 [Vespula vulgaris]
MFAAMVLHKHNKQNNGNNSNNHHHHHQQQHHNNHHTRNNNTSGTSNNFNNNHINNNVSNVNQAFGARTSPFNARIVRAHTCCFLSGSKCVLLIRCCSFPSSPFRLMESYVHRTKMKLLAFKTII